jgi:hypothetical protein
LVLLPLRKEMTLSVLQIQAWEAPGWTSTIQGKFGNESKVNL